MSVKNKLETFNRIIERINQADNNRLKNATRLWNWADHQNESDVWFYLITEKMAWAFWDASNPNSMRFTY